MGPRPFGLLAILFLVGNLALSTQKQTAQKRIINGKQVPAGVHTEIVRISSNGAGCTATVVGPKVLVTAAHCAKTGTTATFKLKGVEYSARIIRSGIYPGQDHDIALGIVSKEVDVKPAHVVSQENTAKTNMDITIYGYGCTQEGGGGGNDGILRYGPSLIISFNGYDMVSKKAGGAALCFGDSGGPAFVTQGRKEIVLGINSKGNIKDTNYNARLDSSESQKFLKETASQEGVEICGINSKCDDTPPPPAPNCSLSASPNVVKVNDPVVITMTTSGQATSASINSQSVPASGGQITVSQSAVGSYTASGSVTGPGGTGTCQTSYMVENEGPPPKKPECTLVADPEWIKLGDRLTLRMETKGSVTQALINGEEVGSPLGNLEVEPEEPGNYTASGVVIGPLGSSTCWAQYKVDGDLPPQMPDFTLVETHCGRNELKPEASRVERVCLASVKKGFEQKDAILKQAVLITLRNGDKEVMPVINMVKKKDNPNKVDVYTYANNVVNSGQFTVLDTRQATVTNQMTGKTPEPVSIKGKAACGHYYIVNQLETSVVPVPIPVALNQTK